MLGVLTFLGGMVYQYRVGERVRHDSYGLGTVTGRTADGSVWVQYDDDKVTLLLRPPPLGDLGSLVLLDEVQLNVSALPNDNWAAPLLAVMDTQAMPSVLDTGSSGISNNGLKIGLKRATCGINSLGRRFMAVELARTVRVVPRFLLERSAFRKDCRLAEPSWTRY